MSAGRRKEAGIEAASRRSFDLLDRELVRDTSISLRALGVAVRLLSNAPGYRMDSLDLSAEGPGREGRDAVRAALRELERAGYLVRKKSQLPNGRWVTQLSISDVIDAAPAPEKPAPVFQAPVNSEKPMTGFPAVGEPGDKSSKPRRNTKSTTTHARVGHLVVPAQLDDGGLAVIDGILEGLTTPEAQAVLDELSALYAAGRPPERPYGWLRECAKRARNGQFLSDAGKVIRARRAEVEKVSAAAERRAKEAARAEARRTDPEAHARDVRYMAVIGEMLR